MKLYVCWGTWKQPGMGPDRTHPCGTAYHALRDAGHEPDVVRAFGLGQLPKAINGPRRAEVDRLSGNQWVPTLVLDDGTVVDGSQRIADWAHAHPA